MFWRIPSIVGEIQAANAQAQIANAQEAFARECCAEQERIQNQHGALNLVERDGVYVLPDLVS